MGKKRGFKGFAIVVIASLIVELAPPAAWAEVGSSSLGSAVAAAGTALATSASLAASADQTAPPEPWTEEADRTQTPQFYTFTGDQVLEERPDPVEDRLGGGGTYLRMEDTPELFPAKAGTLNLTWTDTLATWIQAQAGTPVNPPAGYTVTVELKDVQSGNIYTLASNQADHSGLNQLAWTGKDADGKPIPDGTY